MAEATPLPGIDESIAEAALMEWLGDLDYEIRLGGEIAPGTPDAERRGYRDAVLVGRLREAIDRLNSGIPAVAREEALRKVLRADSPSLVVNNRAFHRMLVDPPEIEVAREGGGIRGLHVKLVDFEDPQNNDWLAVNQYTVHERSHRRPDVVVFVNGLPLGVIELKNPADEDADIWDAYRQVQTYKQEIPSLLSFNEVVVISDGVDARVGSLTSPREWFLPWRTIEGGELAPDTANRLEVLARGVFDKGRFLDLIRHFIVFQEDGDLRKVIAGYHQFHAARKAVATTLLAADPSGDGRGGVVWHTQGSGKSLTMAFFAGKLVLAPELENPTIVVITDRNDLDDQLFGVFAASEDLIRQAPVQVADRADLRKELTRASGGVIFTTMQKFLPEQKGDTFPQLSDRRNIVVIADEAHRSQYGFIKGLAKHLRDALPSATFVGFTGTPVELEDRDTRAVFGDYVDVYDVQRAVDDGATVPIYYESRLAKLDLAEDEKPKLDVEFEEVTEGEEVARKERLKTKWAQLEAVVGSRRRLELIARDLVDHFEKRLEAMDGKAMVVCMSRRICVDLYDELVKLRPDWHSDADEGGEIKVVMTGSAADPPEWQKHIRSKRAREAMAQRFKDAADPFNVVIVRDMWLTGFDVPSLHTMYLDKPIRGHTLMQAIARVNRVFRDKPGGLVVDYLGLADDLRKALATYTESGGKGEAAVNQDEAVAVMLERYEVCRDLFHGFDYMVYFTGSADEKMKMLPSAQEHVLHQPDGKDRFVKAVIGLSKAFALSVPRQEALDIRDEVAFFQTVKAALVKTERGQRRPEEDLDHAIKQIVSGAIAPEGMIDVFDAAGLQKPDISILSDEFLAEVREMPYRNLAVELLQKLLNDEIKTRARRNVVQSRAFSEMLESALRKYQARAITTAQVIEELIELARQMREAARRGEDLGLTDEELAFYDALETNDSAVAVLGDETLREIARELTETVRRNATIDWSVKETARANLRRMVRRILRKHGYPPDKSEKATQTVLEQAVQLGFEFSEEAATEVEEEPAVGQGPFEVLAGGEARPYENCVPLLSLKAAAGALGSDEKAVEAEAWVRPNGRIRPAPGLFVAQVVGESMNRRIPNGAYCVFRHPVEGSRQGRVVLVEHRAILDPELGGSFTLKVWESDKEELDDGTWRHREIRLVPDTSIPEYQPIILRDVAEDEMSVVAELVEVLPATSRG
jgi:type I restriction enzyme R subunit